MLPLTHFLTVSTVRDMSSAEVHELYRLRVDVFVAEQNCPYREIETADASIDTHHIMLWCNPAPASSAGTKGGRQLLGCARVTPVAENQVLVGRIVVRRDQRGQGLGQELVREGINVARSEYPDREIILNAQSHLRAFYEQLGFSVCGEEFEESGIKHLPMRYSAA